MRVMDLSIVDFLKSKCSADVLSRFISFAKECSIIIRSNSLAVDTPFISSVYLVAFVIFTSFSCFSIIVFASRINREGSSVFGTKHRISFLTFAMQENGISFVIVHNTSPYDGINLLDG